MLARSANKASETSGTCAARSSAERSVVETKRPSKSARRLAFRDGVAEGRGLAGAGPIVEHDGVARRIEARVSRQSTGGGGKRQIFRSAAEAGVKMVVVGIDGRGPPGQVRRNADGLAGRVETPWLRVVAVRGERRIANDAIQVRAAAKRRAKRFHGACIIGCRTGHCEASGQRPAGQNRRSAADKQGSPFHMSSRFAPSPYMTYRPSQA